MRVCPDITQTWVITVMKTLVNFKVVDLEVPRSIRGGSTIFSNKRGAKKIPQLFVGGFCSLSSS